MVCYLQQNIVMDILFLGIVFHNIYQRNLEEDLSFLISFLLSFLSSLFLSLSSYIIFSVTFLFFDDFSKLQFSYLKEEIHIFILHEIFMG